MKSNRVMIGLVIGVLFAGTLVCATAAGLGIYFGFGERVEAFFENPTQLIEEVVSPATEIPATETPFGADVDLETLFAPVWEARRILHNDFVSQPIDDAILAQGALDGLNGILEQLGVNVAAVDLPSTAPSARDLADEAQTPADIIDDFLPFFTIWGQAEYANLEGLTSYDDLMRASLASMVSSLGDPHTTYLDPAELSQEILGLDGEYEGIGAWVDPTGEYLAIIAPMEGSPAEAAGLQPGDIVVAVDGEDMTGVDGNAVISRIVGPAGSLVVLTIQRDGSAANFDVEIERASIFVPSVQSEILEGNIAYIQLLTFGASTSIELENALSDLLAQNPQGLILDMRNNGGGFLHTSVEVTSQFLSDGIVLFEEFGDGSQQVYDVNEGGLATEINMVVLINGGSASASEIVAGALQDTGRATLIGELSFGKASVQLSPVLENGQGALRVTIAYFLTPNETLLHGVGISPDIEVEFTQEDADAEIDPQLDAAIEFLSN